MLTPGCWMLAAAALLAFSTEARAHPLGNFTVSHYAGFTASRDGLQLRYVLDHAEIPAFQERQAIDRDHDDRVTPTEEGAYLTGKSRALLQGLSLEVDGRPASLTLTARRLSWTPGAGGLPVLRLELDALLPAARLAGGWHTIQYRDNNLPARAGWKEIVVRATPGATIAGSTAPAADRSRALTAYPQDRLSSPPQDLIARFRVTLTAPLAGSDRPGVGSTAAPPTPTIRDQKSSAEPRTPAFGADLLTRLIQRQSFPIAFLPLALAIAFGLGCLHALSPGHGKTMVAAYLVGSRGTARDAILLGLTVTISHTIGVFALGLVVLYASRWIVPERLYPWFGFASGAAICAIGLSLFVSRLKGLGGHQHVPGLWHRHQPVPAPAPTPTRMFLPVGDRVSSTSTIPNTERPTPDAQRRNTLLLGISGGIIPCPSALVVLLSAIALHRVGLGLLLILAFSAGLAVVLTGIGLLTVYASRLMERLPWDGGLFRRLPVVSAAVVCVLGAAVALQSLTSGGAVPRIVLSAAVVAPLLFGFVLGMKHALETDHLVAVSTIVAEQGSLMRSALVGAFWGLGHTSSLLVAALLVIVLRIRIPERVAMGLEFTVALMLIALGIQAVRAWQVSDEQGSASSFIPHPASLTRCPYLVGLIHGLAGSAALMLLVLTTIPSPWTALLYVLLFGLGSVAGMLGMSVLLSLPLRLTAHRLGGMIGHVRLAAGLASAAFGLFMSWQIGFVDGLFR